MTRDISSHHWNKLPAPRDRLVLLLVENAYNTKHQWVVTGYLDADSNEYISALPTRHHIETESVVVKQWAPVRILPPVQPRKRLVF